MNEYYELLWLYTNFFLPSAKLLNKIRDGSKIRKRYDTPQSPYKGLLFSPNVDKDVKKSLRETFLTLNPAELKRGMITLLDRLLKLRKA